MIKYEILKQYCEGEYSGVGHGAEPFYKNGFTYATDRRIIIRNHNQNQGQYFYNALAERAENLPWDHDKIKEWKKFPKEAYDYKPEIVIDDDGEEGEKEKRMRLGVNVFNVRYLNLIVKNFPDAVYAEVKILDPMRFKADGMEGLLMPMKDLKPV